MYIIYFKLHFSFLLTKASIQKMSEKIYNNKIQIGLMLIITRMNE